MTVHSSTSDRRIMSAECAPPKPVYHPTLETQEIFMGA